MEKPLILVDPLPRALDAHLRCGRHGSGWSGSGGSSCRGPADAGDEVDSLLPDAEIIIGQTELPAERLARAPRTAGHCQRETNFAQRRLPGLPGAAIHVITSCARPSHRRSRSRRWRMAIDLVRGITAADRAFRDGTRECTGSPANEGCFLFGGAAVGLIDSAIWPGACARCSCRSTIP